MKMTRILAPILVAGVLISGLTSVPAIAQSTITMDSDRCSSGLDAFSGFIGGKITLQSAPRRMAGKCQASDVSFSDVKGTVDLDIDRLIWTENSLSGFETRKVPNLIDLKLTGVTIARSPLNKPLWTFLKSQSNLSSGLDLVVKASFSSETKRLDFTRILLGFQGGNKIAASAQVSGVPAQVPTRPELALVGMRLTDLNLGIRGNSTFSADLVKNVLQAADISYNSSIELSDIRARIQQYTDTHITSLTTSDSLSDLKRMIADLPSPKGSVLVRLISDSGLSAVQIVAIALGSDPAPLLAETDLQFSYQPGQMTLPGE